MRSKNSPPPISAADLARAKSELTIAASNPLPEWRPKEEGPRTEEHFAFMLLEDWKDRHGRPTHAEYWRRNIRRYWANLYTKSFVNKLNAGRPRGGAQTIVLEKLLANEALTLAELKNQLANDPRIAFDGAVYTVIASGSQLKATSLKATLSKLKTKLPSGIR